MVCSCSRNGMNAFCASLSESAREALCSSARMVDFKKRERISLSAVQDEVAIIRQGVVACQVVRSESARSIASFIAVKGDVINIMRVPGDTAAYQENFNEADWGYVLQPVRICSVRLDLLRELLADVTMAKAVIGQLSDRYKDVMERMHQLRFDGSEQRVRWLLGYLEQRGVDAASVTHEEMAQMLGMNRVTVTRAINELL